MFSAIRATLTPRSVRTRLTFWYLLMLGAALTAFAVFVFVMRERTLVHDADRDLALRAERIVVEIRPTLLELDLEAALAADPRLGDDPIVVRNAWGALIYRSPAFPALRARGDSIAARAVRVGDSLTDVEDRDGNDYRLATVLVPRAGTTPIAVQTTMALAPIDHMLWQLVMTMVVCFALIMACASLGGSFIARRALEPVDHIVSRVREIQASRLDDRVDLRTGSAELDRLVETLNDMLDRLAASVHGARRFAADASHELQTPIAAMRAALDACVTDRYKSAKEYREMSEDVVAELDRLSALVRDMRLLSIADAGHLVDHSEPLEIGSLVRDCCEIVHAVAESRRIVISVDIIADGSVRGSAMHLRRAVMNLAENAVKFSPDGSTVQVTVGRLDTEIVLVIVDEGCGIDARDLPHIFERFYRADPARARETGGSGLGLAIADQIVRSHGGRIEVSSVVGQGSIFTVFLPLVAAVDRPRVAAASRSVNAA
jgi:heavy metal sensor kinase